MAERVFKYTIFINNGAWNKWDNGLAFLGL